MDQEAKPFWQSIGVLGSSAVIGATLARLLGVDIGPDDWNEAVRIVTHGQAVLADLVDLAGAAMALYGRVRARQPLAFAR